MDQSNTDFPHSMQSVGSKSCGPTCLKNIFEFYGQVRSLDEILKEMIIDANQPTHVAQLASYVMSKGHQTLILTSCPDTFSPDWKDETKPNLINLLKRWTTENINHSWLKDALYLLYYLMEGGEVMAVDLSTKILDKHLEDGGQILACIDETWIWEKRKISGVIEYDSIKGRANGHFVVIYGKDENDYLISDPYPTKLPNKEGLYKVNKDKMLVSILVWAKQVLVINK